MSTVTPAQKRAAISLMLAITEAIRELGRVPSGELYARVMGTLDLRTYELIIDRLKSTGLIEEKNHELIWVGPALQKETK